DTNRPGTPWTSPHGPTTLVAASAPMRAVPTGWNAVRRSEPGFTASSFSSSSCDLLVTGPRPGRPLNTARAPAARKISAVCANPRHARCDFDHHVERLVPVIDVERLQRAAPAVYVFVEIRADSRRGVDAQVPSELPRQIPDGVVRKEARRVDRAARNDDDLCA